MSLSEFETSILKKLDDLCNRMTKMEEKIKNHLIYSERNEKSKREKIYIVIALVSAVIAIYQSISS